MLLTTILLFLHSFYFCTFCIQRGDAEVLRTHVTLYLCASAFHNVYIISPTPDSKAV